MNSLRLLPRISYRRLYSTAAKTQIASLSKRQVAALSKNQHEVEWSLEVDERRQAKIQPMIDKILYNPGPEVLEDLSEEKHLRVKAVKEEYQIYCQHNPPMPELTPRIMLDLLQLTSKSARKRKYHFLKKKHSIRKSEKEKKKQKKQLLAELATEGPKEKRNKILYGPKENMIDLMNWRLINAKLYGIPLIFDLDFSSKMENRGRSSLISQLGLVYSNNRQSSHPFNLVFANCQLDGRFVAELLVYFQLGFKDMFLDWSEDCYTNLYPRENLVYLTPHSDEVLTEFKDTEVYIIGGLVDLTDFTPYTAIKAKELGIRTARLPLLETFGFTAGQSLCVNHVFQIMLDLKRHGQMEEALRAHVPTRKVHPSRVLKEEVLQARLEAIKSRSSS